MTTKGSVFTAAAPANLSLEQFPGTQPRAWRPSLDQNEYIVWGGVSSVSIIASPSETRRGTSDAASDSSGAGSREERERKREKNQYLGTYKTKTNAANASTHS